MTPNREEAFKLAKFEINSLRGSSEDILEVGAFLRDQLDCSSLILTRGSEGMSLFSSEGEVFHLPTYAREVFDVTGAGDTVIATLALGMTIGLSPEKSCIFG